MKKGTKFWRAFLIYCPSYDASLIFINKTLVSGKVLLNNNNPKFKHPTATIAINAKKFVPLVSGKIGIPRIDLITAEKEG